MKRRSLFQLIAGAIVASALELGVITPAPKAPPVTSALDKYFAEDAEKIMGLVGRPGHGIARFMSKEPFRENMGYNYSTVPTR